jgi:hypothetical protein
MIRIKTINKLLSYGAISCIAFHPYSYATNLFSDELLNSVIKSAAKELNKGLANKESNPPAKASKAKNPKKRVLPLTEPTTAKELYKQYKDWSAYVKTEQDSRGEWETLCTISTGGDGDDSISAIFNWGEKNKRNMPSVDYSEATARGYPTNLQNNQEVSWLVRVGNKTVSYSGTSYAGIDQEGIPYAVNRIQGNIDDSSVLSLFRSFAKGSKVVIFDEYSGGDLYVGSLSGFSASYRKASEWCGFSVNNVFSK